MSSRFLKDVQGIYFAGDGGVGVGAGLGASSTLRRRFQCSPAMATCDGMYPPPQEKDTEQENEKPTVLPSLHPEHDEEQDTYIRLQEMKKMQDGAAAMKKVLDADGCAGVGGVGGGSSIGLGHTGCDMTGDEFMIVCEELWVDFKLWANRDENVSRSFLKTRNFVARYYTTMLLTAIFFIWFRWYIGGGKEACDRGFGIGLCSFICEVARNLGEIIIGIILGIGGFCTGLLPLLLGVCVYEIKNMDSCDDVNGGDDHEKKE
jgi:hypothetical protein